MKNKFTKIIIEWFKIKQISVKQNTDLFSNNKIDSFGFIELLIYIEKSSKIKLDHEEIFMKKKLTISDLSSIIDKSAYSKIKKKNRKLIINYLRKNFKNNHILYKSKKLFDWQYLSKNNYNFYFFKKRNKIKAVQGFIPTSRYDESIKNDTIFLSIWSSSEISAGSKLFFSFIKKIKYKLLVGLGSTKESFSFQKMLNFKCGYMDHFFLTSNSKPKLIISPSNFTNMKKERINKNFKKLNSLEKISAIDENIFKNQYPKKSKKYLINRYFLHPFYRYHLYEILDINKNPALFVFRICKYKKKSAIRIVDFIGEKNSFEHGKFLFRYLLKKYQAEYIDIYSYGIPKKILRNSGLESISKYNNKKIIVPNYFEPFVKKNVRLAYALKYKLEIRNNIKLFKGDSDLDRPNKI